MSRFILSSMVLYFFSMSVFTLYIIHSWMKFQHFPHSCAAWRWHLYSSRLSVSFFLCRNFSSSFTLITLAFWAVCWEAGDVFGIFICAYLGIMLYFRHCRLKYKFAQHLATFVNHSNKICSRL